jgi:anti-sigma factor RsiW
MRLIKACDHRALSRYVDGELVGEQRLEVDRHLRSCANCRNVLMQLRDMNALLLRWGSRRMPMSLEAEARIQASVVRRERRWSVLSISRMMPAAMGTCVAAVLVLLSANLGMIDRPTQEIQTPAAHPTVRQLIKKETDALRKERVTEAMLGAGSSRVVPGTVRYRGRSSRLS